MAFEQLTGEQIAGLVGGRHRLAGFEYPVDGLQPYYEWLIGTLHLLGEASAGGLRVGGDDSNGTSVVVAEGRATVGGVVVVYGGGALDLGVYNNETAYLWLADFGGGVGVVSAGSSSGGWPVGAHMKLAEVTLAGGAIVGLIDRRFETVFGVGIGGDAGLFVGYQMAVVVAGSTSVASTVTITKTDFYGNALGGAGFLRVRVCDGGGYVAATNATIGAAGGTTVVETVAGGKDLVLQSDGVGVFTVDVTDAVAETVTLRVGAGPVSGGRGDYSVTLDVTHV